jgi:hypothetical protein
MKQVTRTQPSSDDLDQAIAVAMLGMHKLREENARLRARNNELEHRGPVMEAEIVNLKEQLKNERSERQHYHSLANEIITRIDVVVCTVDDVVQRAYSMCKDQPYADLPALKIPAFLKRSTAAADHAEPQIQTPRLSDGYANQVRALSKPAA